MARAKGKEDFTLDVDNIGRFTFGRRRQADVYKIRGLYSQWTGGNWKDDGTVGDMEAYMHATLEVMTVEYPPGFTLQSIDPLTGPEDDDRIAAIYVALRNKELSFRQKPAEGSTGESAGTGS
jgi:hypothetical protein